MKKNKKKKNVLYNLFKIILLLLKLPFILIKFCISLFKESKQKIKKINQKHKRILIESKYEEVKIIKSEKGKYLDLFNNLLKSDSQIGIVLGSRGSGKSAFGLKLLENIHSKSNKKIFAIGFNEEELPEWINSISDIAQITNKSFVLIDEGGILFNSRKSMTNANRLLSELIMIARHKDISILFVSQNSSNLEVNILRQADFLILKKSSLLQKDFERKIIQEIYKKIQEDFEKYNEIKGLTYVYSNKFQGFIDIPLPSFWKEKISKSWA